MLRSIGALASGLGRWMGGWLGPEPDFDAHTPSATRNTMDTLENTYLPTILDVVIVKAMLIKGLHLPPELVDNVVDQAGYWPHATSEVDFETNPDNHANHHVSSHTSNSPNEFLVSIPPPGCPTKYASF